MVLDSIIVLTAIYAGYFILNPTLKVFTIPTLIFSSICLLISHHLFAFIYRLYQKAWEYASVGEMVAIIRAITLSIVTTACMQILINHDVYVRVMVVTWMLHILLIGGSRFSWRMYRDHYIKPKHEKKRALIIGAGSAGSMLVRQLVKNYDAELLQSGSLMMTRKSTSFRSTVSKCLVRRKIFLSL